MNYSDRFTMVATDKLLSDFPELRLHTCLRVQRNYSKSRQDVIATGCFGEYEFILGQLEFQCIQRIH
jgi:hypothetical protein